MMTAVFKASGYLYPTSVLGLVESPGEFYPEAMWQRCTVPFYRIHAQEDRVAAQQKAAQVAGKTQGDEARGCGRLGGLRNRRRCSTTHFPASTGVFCGPITRWNAFRGRCGEKPEWSEHFGDGPPKRPPSGPDRIEEPYRYSHYTAFTRGNYFLGARTFTESVINGGFNGPSQEV
jgi:hypothetical protein